MIIEPGIYNEEVKVKGRIDDGLHIRGMNRNTVILDGTGLENSKGSNGIEIGETYGSAAELTDDVTVENMTARNFEQEPGGSRRERLWWSGGDETGKVKGRGWWVATSPPTTPGCTAATGSSPNNEIEGEWEHIYASGFNDSGMYLGACQECQARIIDPVMEYNQLGYSGSNSGGSLVIEDGIFRHNSSGVAPNGENPGDGTPRAERAVQPRPQEQNTEGSAGIHDDENRALHDHPSQPHHGKQQQQNPGHGLRGRRPVRSGRRASGRLRRPGRGKRNHQKRQ